MNAKLSRIQSLGTQVVVIALLFAALPCVLAQTNITAWTFDNLPAAINNTPTPSTGAGTASVLGMNNSYNSSNSIASADVLSDAGSSSGGPNAWRIRGNPGNGWSSQAPIGTQGAEFRASTAGYDGIKVGFDLHTTAQAEANLAVLYTTDGGVTWSNATPAYAGSGAVVKNNTFSTNTVQGGYIQFQNASAPWYNGISADLSGVSAVNNNPNFAIKLVNASTGADDINQSGTAYNNSSGNWRYDNVVISGTPGTARVTPNFSGLTASQSILAGTASIALTGKVSAAGPVYPPSTESVIVNINGTSLTNAFNDATGDFALTFPAATITAGTYPITYTYAGDATLNAAANASTSLTVTNLVPTPQVSLTSPTNNAIFITGANITIAASAVETGGSITNVAFYSGTTSLANVGAAPYTFGWSGVPPGNYKLTAVATDSLGAQATSSVVNVTITNAPVIIPLPPIRTVFVIALENHNWTQPVPTSSPEQVFGNPAAPYLNSLVTPGNPNAAQVSYATHYYNAGVGVHGSEPNYIWSEAGSDFGVHASSDPSAAAGNLFTVPHLTAQLNAAGIPWKNYQEDMEYSSAANISASGSGVAVNPYNGSTEYNYAVKHNPMAFFTDTELQNVYPLTNFVHDLTNNTIGRYNWITPDELNEMHTALTKGFTYHGIAYSGDQSAVAQGDNFLSQFVPLIMASQAYQSNGLIVIWWDESEGGDTTNYPLGEIIISPQVKGNAYASTLEYSHSSDLKTMDEIFGLNYVSNSIPASETRVAGTGYNNVATVNDFSDMFASKPSIGVQQPAGAALVNGTGSVDFGSVIVGANSSVQTFTVTNAGNAGLTINGFAFGGANPGDFTISGLALPATISAADSANFQVVFAPSSVGARGATLQITNTDATANPFVVNLAGQGSVITPTAFNLSKSATAGYNLSFNVGTNQSYRILASSQVNTPLSDWIQVAAGIALTNPVFINDATLLGSRFYRVVSP